MLIYTYFKIPSDIVIPLNAIILYSQQYLESFLYIILAVLWPAIHYCDLYYLSWRDVLRPVSSFQYIIIVQDSRDFAKYWFPVGTLYCYILPRHIGVLFSYLDFIALCFDGTANCHPSQNIFSMKVSDPMSASIYNRLLPRKTEMWTSLWWKENFVMPNSDKP